MSRRPGPGVEAAGLDWLLSGGGSSSRYRPEAGARDGRYRSSRCNSTEDCYSGQLAARLAADRLSNRGIGVSCLHPRH